MGELLRVWPGYLTPGPFPRREGVPEHALAPMHIIVFVLAARVTWVSVQEYLDER